MINSLKNSTGYKRRDISGVFCLKKQHQLFFNDMYIPGRKISRKLLHIVYEKGSADTWSGRGSEPSPPIKRHSVGVQPSNMPCIPQARFACHWHLVPTRTDWIFELWLKICSHMSSFVLFSFINKNWTVKCWNLKRKFQQS